MAKADISINGKRYLVACDDGQEDRLRHLASHFDSRVGDMSAALGDIGTERLFLAAALSIIDELEDVKTQSSSTAAEAETRLHALEDAAMNALINAADRIERMSGRVEDAG